MENGNEEIGKRSQGRPKGCSGRKMGKDQKELMLAIREEAVRQYGSVYAFANNGVPSMGMPYVYKALSGNTDVRISAIYEMANALGYKIGLAKK